MHRQNTLKWCVVSAWTATLLIIAKYIPGQTKTINPYHQTCGRGFGYSLKYLRISEKNIINYIHVYLGEKT